MSENILVVEYEPRYTDRVRQALSGQSFEPTFAKDGEEAMRALDAAHPKLIVLSSVVPKISTSELIRAIRGRKPLQETPILLTVSGYNGKSPKADAQRLGASDILPKPYSESEFLGKVQQMLGVRADAPAPQWVPELDPDFTVRASAPPAGGQLTSNEIFGDILDEAQPSPAGAKKTMAKPKDDLDKMLADTLAGVMPQRKKETPATPAPAPAPPPAAPTAAPPKPKTQSGSASFDKLLNDTLSGLEKTARKPTSPGSIPLPASAKAPEPSAPSAPAAPQPSRYNTERLQALSPDRVPVSQPVFTPEPVRHHDEDEPSDGTKFGQYVLVEKIATGGMAEVWKARMRGVEGFQKIVAIKKILPHLSDNQDFIEMFVDEAKLAAQLNHNNIIHIYDLGKIQNSYYIAMEYIDGFDLKTILRRGQERDQPMTVELALFIASKLASALDYAHRKKDFEEKEMGLVHRDVSPQNVLVSQEGDIKLCDFGIAKAASKASHTQAGALKGKLQYMSPEQAWGRNIDRRSDVFALATVLFEMLTGRKLFTGDNELSILEQVREAHIARPSEFNDEVTPEVDKIVLKALQKDPAGRYQTAGEMARDLDAVLYSFRPTPTSADLAIYMHRLTSAEPVMPMDEAPAFEEPKPVIAPAPPPVVVAPPVMSQAPAPAMAAPSYEAATSAPKEGKSPMVLIGIAAVVVIAIIGAVFALKGRGGANAAAATPAPVTASTATTAPPLATPAATSSTAAPLTASAAPIPTTTAIDPNAVDAEVQKRLAAERTRLEQLARQQQAAAAAAGRPAPATATQAPPPQVAQQQPAETRPAPVQQPETRPTPPPAPVQQPVQQAEAPREAPATATQAPRVREGDLVAAGTDGLVAPRITRRGSVPYPPIARVQRVEGTVITSVLVSEEGRPIDVKVLRGVNRAGGLNEAAVETMKRSSFSPATKDGVKVKAWLTVPVEFKL